MKTKIEDIRKGDQIVMYTDHWRVELKFSKTDRFKHRVVLFVNEHRVLQGGAMKGYVEFRAADVRQGRTFNEPLARYNAFEHVAPGTMVEAK